MTKRLMLYFLVYFLCTIYSCAQESHNHTVDNGIVVDSSDLIRDSSRYDDILVNPSQEQPSFQGCDHLVTKSERKRCSDEKLIQFIRDHLVYPKQAKQSKQEGTVIVRFTVKKDGSLEDFEVMRDIGYGCGEAAVKMLQLMPNFSPGTLMGKFVDVKYTVPVKFSLNPHQDTTNRKRKIQDHSIPPPPPPPPKFESKPYKKGVPVLVDVPARFPGCEDEPEALRKKCSDEKIIEFINLHLKFPTTVPNNCLSGTCVIRFIVEKDGSLSDVEVVRDAGCGTAEEALKVVNAMPKWIPAIHDGEVTRSYFNLPIRFRLSE